MKKTFIHLLPRQGRWGAALAIMVLLALPQPALAHGVVAQSGKGGDTAWAQCNYDDGEPMSFAEVKVTGPSKSVHQVGHADRQGRFAWFPAGSGTYTAVFKDGLGHRGQVELTWSATPGSLSTGTPEDQESSPNADSSSVSRWSRAVWGISAIFWLSGLIFWLQARRLKRKTQ